MSDTAKRETIFTGKEAMEILVNSAQALGRLTPFSEKRRVSMDAIGTGNDMSFKITVGEEV